MTDKQIKYEQNAKDCELAKSGSCCYCKNIACYKLEEQLKAKEQECEELKKNYRKQLHKNVEKQCRINELQNSVATKEFILKVNGKKYTNLSGIDKARLFINDENGVRNKKIIKLENEISSLQWKFYNNCKKVVEAQQQLDQLKADREEALKQLEFVRTLNTVQESENRKLSKTLTEIKEIAEHCINQDICTTCDNSDKCHIEDEEIPTYDVCKLILQKISECEVKDE